MELKKVGRNGAGECSFSLILLEVVLKTVLNILLDKILMWLSPNIVRIAIK